MKMSRGEKAYRGVLTAVATIVMLLCLYPLLYTLFVSLCSDAEWTRRGGILLFLPSEPTFLAYSKLLAMGGTVIRAIGISLVRTVCGTLLSVTFTGLTGYVLSFKGMPGKKAYLNIILFTIFFSGGLIPTKLVIDDLGFTNTLWSLIIPGLVGSWNVLIFKQFFEGLPRDIIDAAEVDGVGELAMFFRIVLPMSTAVFAAIGLFTVVGHWNSWFDVSIYIDSAHSHLWTLQYFTMITFNNLAQMDAGASDIVESIMGASGTSPLTNRMALTIITFLPIMIIYPFFQKYFTKGVYLGAVKG
jgi:ABC transporter, permease protein